MESPLPLFRMHWDHEPTPTGRARCPHRAAPGGLRTARPTWRFMESDQRGKPARHDHLVEKAKTRTGHASRASVTEGGKCREMESHFAIDSAGWICEEATQLDSQVAINRQFRSTRRLFVGSALTIT